MTPTPVLSPVRIDPEAVYTVGAVVLGLAIPSATIAKARRAGELPFVRRGHRVYIAGRDLRAWLTPAAPGGAGEGVNRG